MSNKVLRMFMCAAVAAVVGTAGTSVRATAYYDVVFDPSFTGEVKFAIGAGCLTKADGFYAAVGACRVDLIFADIVDSTGKGWESGFQSFVGLIVQIVDGELNQLLTRPIFLEPAPNEVELGLRTSNHDEDCNGILQFFINSHGPPGASFQGCHQTHADTDTYQLVHGTVDSRIPEPGTLGLLLGGVGAAWLTRRRKLTA